MVPPLPRWWVEEEKGMRKTVALAVALGLSVSAFACGGSPSGPSRSGSLKLMITDSPFGDATAVHVTFSKVEVHRDEGEVGWLTVPFAGEPAPPSRTCNLKKLQDATDVLGVASLEAGHYTQLRLIVSTATIYFGGEPVPADQPACAATLPAPTGSTSPAVDIPSGEVKLVREFDLTANGATTIELDFDGDASLRQTGNGRYVLGPVIRILKVNTTGGA
jgi:uncharacterized protein DUF4382